MKNSLFVFLAIIAMLCSCQPVIQYEKGTKLCYIDTKDGRLWGIGWNGQCYVYPEYESIDENYDVNGYIARKQGKYYFFDCNETLGCNGEALLTPLEKQDTYVGMGCYEHFYKTESQNGVYAIFGSNCWPGDVTYGPFADFVPGNCGYMFKDAQTGKWGVGKYGNWKQHNPKAWVPESRYSFTPCDSILIAPQYEKIVNVAYVREGYTFEWIGYYKQSDIKWYCFDGKNWHGFDIEGKSIAVNQKLLKQALNKKLTSQVDFRFNYQRLGKDEASTYIIYIELIETWRSAHGLTY